MHNRYDHEKARRIRLISGKIVRLGILTKTPTYPRCDFEDEAWDDIRDYKPRRIKR